jgi:uncharacterized phage protein (TIGR01671 family)
MSREIKFKRAYFENEDKTKFIRFSLWGVGIGDSTFTSPTNMVRSQSFIDYQFTGLKDKNGKEIYEGDILLLEDVFPEKYTVTFCGGCFCLLDKYHTELPINFTVIANEISEALCSIQLKIIGNIHDNKNLLK